MIIIPPAAQRDQGATVGVYVGYSILSSWLALEQGSFWTFCCILSPIHRFKLVQVASGLNTTVHLRPSMMVRVGIRCPGKICHSLRVCTGNIHVNILHLSHAMVLVLATCSSGLKSAMWFPSKFCRSGPFSINMRLSPVESTLWVTTVYPLDGIHRNVQ